MIQTENTTSQADAIVKRYMVGSVLVGLVPVPWVDLVALMGIQLKMLAKISKCYSIEFSHNQGKSLLAALIGGGVPWSFSRNFVRLTKSVPVYGRITGMVSMSIFGSASTYAVGKVFIQHFESGGTFLTFDPNKAAADYAKYFRKVEEDSVGIKP
jgi:uncharacterized protein (DUF697 family)